MPKQILRLPRNLVSTRKPLRPPLLRFEQRGSIAGTLETVVAMRGGLNSRAKRGIDIRSLRELKAENAELRNAAIQLALEIVELRTAQ
jgi:hypothetical protein